MSPREPFHRPGCHPKGTPDQCFSTSKGEKNGEKSRRRESYFNHHHYIQTTIKGQLLSVLSALRGHSQPLESPRASPAHGSRSSVSAETWASSPCQSRSACLWSHLLEGAQPHIVGIFSPCLQPRLLVLLTAFPGSGSLPCLGLLFL